MTRVIGANDACHIWHNRKLCYHAFMKQSKLEPGILQVLKILAIFQVFGILFVRRTIGAAMGIELPLARWLAFTLTVPSLLVLFTWIPWFHQKLRSAYVPFCLGIAGISL